MLTLREAALSVKGSGWAWFCRGEGGRLFVTSTANQDNPLMKIEGIVNGTPLLGIDVWEHAYYLKYFDNRGDYFDAVWKLINWNEVERLRKAQ
jgi:Fe-Mn family superoxide dismutase